MRGKAGTGATVAIRIEGKVKRTRRYKGVDAVLHSDRQIENEILGLAHEEMVVLQKSEGGKVRPVVKTGNRINRKMDFLSEVVEKGLYGSRVSTLFAGAQGNEDIDIMWARQVRNPDSLKVPLDQGGFDQHQSLPTIRAVLTAIGDVCISATRPGSEYRRVWEVLWHSLIGRRVEIRLGGESFTWGNGIPSGWRWTALLDTLLNYCSLKAIQGVTQIRVGRGIPLGNITVQGDDVMMTAKNLEDAAEIIAGYGDAGYEVHPSKTFFSRERGEFLRRSYEPGIITGYITRTQLAIRFRNPVLEMPVSKEERAASRAALWILFRNMGADAGRVAGRGNNKGRCSCQAICESGANGGDSGELCPYAQAGPRWSWHRSCPEARHHTRGSGEKCGPPQGGRRRLRDLKGDWQYSGATWSSVAGGITPDPCNCGVSGRELPYGNLQRYKIPGNHVCAGCVLPEGVLEDGVHLLVRVLPRGQAKNVVSVYNMLRDKWGCYCIHQLRSSLKQLSGEAKRGGRFIHRWWRNITHWDLMFGYTQYKALDELKPEVVDWLVTPKKIGEGLCGEEKYVDLIYQQAVSFLRAEWRLPREVPTLREWVAAGTWMRGKAGTGGSYLYRLKEDVHVPGVTRGWMLSCTVTLR
ncbi:hypothetical protein ACJJTC_018841 [Scirpophaga incertulas]